MPVFYFAGILFAKQKLLKVRATRIGDIDRDCEIKKRKFVRKTLANRTYV